MAFESRYWRAQIKRDINFLGKKINIRVRGIESDDAIDQIFSQIEIKLFTMAYSLRKLMDTKRFPDKISKTKIRAKRYKHNKKRIRPLGIFDDYYEISSRGEEVNLEIREVCNQFTHSYFFQPCPNSRGCLKILFFVSDRDKNKYLYSLDIKYFLGRILQIIDKDSKEMHIIFDEKENDYNIICK